MKTSLLIGLLVVLVGCASHKRSPPTPPPTRVCLTELRWEIPTTRQDGSPLSQQELKQYDLYIENDAHQVQRIVIPSPYITRHRLNQSRPDQYRYWITATDTEGRVSQPSNIEDKQCTP